MTEHDGRKQHPSEDESCLFLELLEWLHPMGGHTLYDDEGHAFASVCGDLNVQPHLPGIRRALERAKDAGISPAALYERATEVHGRINAERRLTHPSWDWPAPPFNDVRPAESGPTTECGAGGR